MANVMTAERVWGQPFASTLDQSQESSFQKTVSDSRENLGNLARKEIPFELNAILNAAQKDEAVVFKSDKLKKFYGYFSEIGIYIYESESSNKVIFSVRALDQLANADYSVRTPKREFSTEVFSTKVESGVMGWARMMAARAKEAVATSENRSETLKKIGAFAIDTTVKSLPAARDLLTKIQTLEHKYGKYKGINIIGKIFSSNSDFIWESAKLSTPMDVTIAEGITAKSYEYDLSDEALKADPKVYLVRQFILYKEGLPYNRDAIKYIASNIFLGGMDEVRNASLDSFIGAIKRFDENSQITRAALEFSTEKTSVLDRVKDIILDKRHLKNLAFNSVLTGLMGGSTIEAIGMLAKNVGMATLSGGLTRLYGILGPIQTILNAIEKIKDKGKTAVIELVVAVIIGIMIFGASDAAQLPGIETSIKNKVLGIQRWMMTAAPRIFVRTGGYGLAAGLLMLWANSSPDEETKHSRSLIVQQMLSAISSTIAAGGLIDSLPNIFTGKNLTWLLAEQSANGGVQPTVHTTAAGDSLRDHELVEPTSTTSKLHTDFDDGSGAMAQEPTVVHQSAAVVQDEVAFKPSESTCLVSGTLVSTAAGVVAIENVKVGDKILGFTEDGKERVEQEVSQTFVHDVEKYYKLQLNTIELKITGDHRVYVGNGEFKGVEELNVGDSLYFDNDGALEAVKLQEKVLVEDPVKVYNFTASVTHTYIANGIAVHNVKKLNEHLGQGTTATAKVIDETQLSPEPFNQPQQQGGSKEVIDTLEEVTAVRSRINNPREGWHDSKTFLMLVDTAAGNADKHPGGLEANYLNYLSPDQRKVLEMPDLEVRVKASKGGNIVDFLKSQEEFKGWKTDVNVRAQINQLSAIWNNRSTAEAIVNVAATGSIYSQHLDWRQVNPSIDNSDVANWKSLSPEKKLQDLPAVISKVSNSDDPRMLEGITRSNLINAKVLHSMSISEWEVIKGMTVSDIDKAGNLYKSLIAKGVRSEIAGQVNTLYTSGATVKQSFAVVDDLQKNPNKLPNIPQPAQTHQDIIKVPGRDSHGISEVKVKVVDLDGNEVANKSNIKIDPVNGLSGGEFVIKAGNATANAELTFSSDGKQITGLLINDKVNNGTKVFVNFNEPVTTAPWDLNGTQFRKATIVSYTPAAGGKFTETKQEVIVAFANDGLANGAVRLAAIKPVGTGTGNNAEEIFKSSKEKEIYHNPGSAGKRFDAAMKVIPFTGNGANGKETGFPSTFPVSKGIAEKFGVKDANLQTPDAIDVSVNGNNQIVKVVGKSEIVIGKMIDGHAYFNAGSSFVTENGLVFSAAKVNKPGWTFNPSEADSYMIIDDKGQTRLTLTHKVNSPTNTIFTTGSRSTTDFVEFNSAGKPIQEHQGTLLIYSVASDGRETSTFAEKIQGAQFQEHNEVFKDGNKVYVKGQVNPVAEIQKITGFSANEESAFVSSVKYQNGNTTTQVLIDKTTGQPMLDTYLVSTKLNGQDVKLLYSRGSVYQVSDSGVTKLTSGSTASGNNFEYGDQKYQIKRVFVQGKPTNNFGVSLYEEPKQAAQGTGSTQPGSNSSSSQTENALDKSDNDGRRIVYKGTNLDENAKFSLEVQNQGKESTYIDVTPIEAKKEFQLIKAEGGDKNGLLPWRPDSGKSMIFWDKNSGKLYDADGNVVGFRFPSNDTGKQYYRIVATSGQIFFVSEDSKAYSTEEIAKQGGDSAGVIEKVGSIEKVMVSVNTQGSSTSALYQEYGVQNSPLFLKPVGQTDLIEISHAVDNPNILLNKHPIALSGQDNSKLFINMEGDKIYNINGEIVGIKQGGNILWHTTSIDGQNNLWMDNTRGNKFGYTGNTAEEIAEKLKTQKAPDFVLGEVNGTPKLYRFLPSTSPIKYSQVQSDGTQRVIEVYRYIMKVDSDNSDKDRVMIYRTDVNQIVGEYVFLDKNDMFGTKVFIRPNLDPIENLPTWSISSKIRTPVGVNIDTSYAEVFNTRGDKISTGVYYVKIGNDNYYYNTDVAGGTYKVTGDSYSKVDDIVIGGKHYQLKLNKELNQVELVDVNAASQTTATIEPTEVPTETSTPVKTASPESTTSSTAESNAGVTQTPSFTETTTPSNSYEVSGKVAVAVKNAGIEFSPETYPQLRKNIEIIDNIIDPKQPLTPEQFTQAAILAKSAGIDLTKPLEGQKVSPVWETFLSETGYFRIDKLSSFEQVLEANEKLKSMFFIGSRPTTFIDKDGLLVPQKMVDLYKAIEKIDGDKGLYDLLNFNNSHDFTFGDYTRYALLVDRYGNFSDGRMMPSDGIPSKDTSELFVFVGIDEKAPFSEFIKLQVGAEKLKNIPMWCFDEKGILIPTRLIQFLRDTPRALVYLSAVVAGGIVGAGGYALSKGLKGKSLPKVKMPQVHMPSRPDLSGVQDSIDKATRSARDGLSSLGKRVSKKSRFAHRKPSNRPLSGSSSGVPNIDSDDSENPEINPPTDRGSF